MAGSYYIALSGMRARLDELDRVAADLANVSTAGYKAERAAMVQADRPQFDAALQSAIDVAGGPSRVDVRAGAITPTGRDLDVAIDGPGMFVVATAAGPRYTRDGRLARRSDGTLVAASGDPVQGEDGRPIRLPDAPVEVRPDGSLQSGGAQVGRLKLVEFAAPEALVKENAHLFRADGQDPRPAAGSTVRAGALEQANVSAIDRMVELTTVTRGFETLQRALALMTNDMDGRVITELGRR